jgi:GNAT superfamily N-acetyltransferase
LSKNPQPVVRIPLADGSVAELRPLTSADGHLLAEGLEHMSLESRYSRFGIGVDHLTESELRYLTDIDLEHHVGWGATIDEEPAGVGRYIVSAANPTRAEIAIAVVDRFQRRGLGRALFDALVSSARTGAVRALVFSVQPSNRSVLKMLRGVEVRLDDTQDLVVGTIKIDDVGPLEHEADHAALLAVYRELQFSSGTSESRSSDAELMQ